jgi:hypothetical protein
MMNNFKTFEEAFFFQNKNNTEDNTIKTVQTGVEEMDLVQFTVGNVVWVCLADDYHLDDYEEWVTQYGVTADGRWAAVSGGHCSCYHWEEMCEDDITYYDLLETLLKADQNANVISKHKDTIESVYTFLNI